MANLIQATVYQINGAPLPSPINLDFQTSNIVIKEASINIGAVNSAILYYNVPNNALSVKTYYVSETIVDLVADANVGDITQVQVTVIEVNKDPQLSAVQYSFPSNEILVGEVIGSATGINSTITFKNDVYSVSETQATILSYVNDLSQFVLNKGGVPSFQANTLANLPLPGTAGKMFVSTDTYAFYRDNGLGWDLIGGPGIGTVTGSGVATQVAFWNGTSVISGSSNLFWDGVNVRLGIGTASPAQQLDVAGATRIQTIANATIDTDKFLVSDSGVIKYRTGSEIISDIGGVTGSGTTNYLSKWTSSSALGNSLVFDNGTSVGIGTTSPSSNLTINNNTSSAIQLQYQGLNGLLIGSYAPASGTFISESRNVNVTFQAGGTDVMKFFGNTGNIGVGTGTNSGFKLDVTGTFRSTLDANINGLTVGKGGGNVATNTAVGVQAINATATGIRNTAIGANALPSVTSGNANTAIGQQALEFLTTGSQNVAVGRASLNSATGSDNTAVGWHSFLGLTTGIGNTAVGSTTGGGITTGNYNTIIGANVTGLSSSLSNTIILADGQGNQRLYINSSGNVGIGTTSPTAGYKLDIVGNAQIINPLATTTLRLGNGAIYTGTIDFGNSYISQTSGPILTIQSNAFLDLSTNFATRIRIASNGNVLIGTTTDAGYKLDVNGTARATSFLSTGKSFKFNDSGTQGQFASDGADTYIDFVGAMRWRRGGGGVNFQFTSSSNFLIGISETAGYPLQVGGSGLFSNNQNGSTSLRVSNTTSGNNAQVQFEMIGSGGNFILGKYSALRTPYKILSGDDSYLINQTVGDISILNDFSTGSIKFGAGGSSTAQMILTSGGSIGVGTTSPNASALLDITSTTKGFLPPRGTNAEMLAIATPATGLMFYDTTNNKVNVYNGTAWEALH